MPSTVSKHHCTARSPPQRVSAFLYSFSARHYLSSEKSRDCPETISRKHELGTRHCDPKAQNTFPMTVACLRIQMELGAAWELGLVFTGSPTTTSAVQIHRGLGSRALFLLPRSRQHTHLASHCLLVRIFSVHSLSSHKYSELLGDADMPLESLSPSFPTSVSYMVNECGCMGRGPRSTSCVISQAPSTVLHLDVGFLCYAGLACSNKPQG